MSRKPLSHRGQNRAQARLSEWGSCQGQGELFIRPQLSKAKAVQTKKDGKR